MICACLPFVGDLPTGQAGKTAAFTGVDVGLRMALSEHLWWQKNYGSKSLGVTPNASATLNKYEIVKLTCPSSILAN